MLHRLRLVLATVLVAIMAIAPSPAIGQEIGTELRGAVERFSGADRQIRDKSRDEYWVARERLSEQALRIAETNLDSKDAERLLHWILQSERSTPTVMKAAKHLAQHHLNSDLTITNLLLYAQHPKQWTPELFVAYSKIELPAEQRFLPDVCRAIHDKTILELADEIKALDANAGSFESHELALGSALVTRLREADTNALATEVVDAFSRLSEQDGEHVVGGITVKELAEGAIFSVRHLRLGKKAQGLAGASIDDKAIALSDYRGKVVLIDFWATWCAPCVTEVPKLRQLVRELDPAKFVLLGVSLDEDETPLREFLTKRDIDWPVVFDAKGRLSARWQALSLPTYYVLDHEHVVRYRGRDFHQAASTAKSLIGSEESAVVAELASMTLKTFDTNNNRRIEKEELPDDKKTVFEAADIDNDGSLSIDELTKFLKVNMKTTKVDPNRPPAN